MTPIDSNKALWKIPSLLKPMHNLYRLISSGNYRSDAKLSCIMLVPSLHNAMATLFSTGIAAHTVLERCEHALSSEHNAEMLL